MRLSGKLAALLVLATSFALHGATIDCEDALLAARNWLRGEKMIVPDISTEVESVFTEDDGDGVAYHVVSLTGGGFVVLASDDGVEPVIAFSASGTFPKAQEGDPVRVLLARDIGERMAANTVAAGTFKRLVFSSGSASYSTPEMKWARLLASAVTNVKQRVYSNGRSGVSDLRVDSLVKSSWGQAKDSGYSNKGNPCYNLYTPNQCACGCVATAMAQIMRYWQYPASVSAFSRVCQVNGVSRILSVSEGPYEWSKMPLDPSKGTTLAQREAIGKLTADCGVALCAEYHGTSWAGAFGGFSHSPLMECFNYANAFTYCSNVKTSEIEPLLYSNFDAGCPVMIGFSDGGYDLHEVVADGYGFVSGTPYVHINVGWTAISGSDLWYNLPNVSFTMNGSGTSDYTCIDNIIYNILPDETGDILSGRVVDQDGNPVSGAEVKVYKTGSTIALDSDKTSQYGIYAFVLPGDATYDVTVKGKTLSGIYLKQSVNPTSVDLQSGSYFPGDMTYGNSWGNDIVVGEDSESDPEPDPDPDPDPEPDPEPTGPAVEINCDLDGTEVMVGQSVVFPLEISCIECTAKSVRVTGLPSGFKFLSGKKAAAYDCDYVIIGTAKRAANKPYTVKVTVQAKPDDTKIKTMSVVAEYAVTVKPIDDWVIGNFSGVANFKGAAATFTMSVKSTGAYSGKVVVGKKSYTFKADGFSDWSGDSYSVSVIPLKSGETLEFDLIQTNFDGVAIGAITNGGVSAVREIWTLKPFKKFLTKYTSQDKSISWTTAGKVTWSTLNAKNKRTKLTATLLPVSCEGENVSLCAYFLLDGKVIRMNVSYCKSEPKSPEISFEDDAAEQI